MKQYIGTKIIKAQPGTMAESQALRSGMSIEQAKRMFKNSGTKDQDGYIVEYPDGYISWSPTKAFEEAYRECENMTFGLALEALKKGCKVARKGWNGKGMFLYLVPAGAYKPCTEIAKKLVNKDGLVDYAPYIAMKTVQGYVVPWLASQTDMLAEDWVIVE